MKKEFKIVICGGGSTYTAGIVKNLLEEEELKIKELWLYDIDQERQEKVSLIVKEVVKDLRPSLELKISTDEEEAFTDADFIMAQMRVGGLKMRVKDEQISLKHGCIGQETCGAGGMAYGMRTIGPMVHLIDVCEKYASKTYWIVNYSNPAAIVAKATQTLRPNARILNICDMPVEVEARMAEILDTDLSNLEVDYFGLNHYGWFTKVQCNGEDVTEKLKKHVAEYGYVSKASYEDALVKDPDWLHTFTNAKKIVNYFPDYLPNTYWQYYLLGDDIVDYMDINNTRGMQVIHGRETKIREAVKKLENGEKIDLTQFYVGVHGKFIVEVVKALAYDTRSRQLVIVKNDGAVKNLPDDAMVEIPAYITKDGPEPVRVGEIPRFYKGLIEQIIEDMRELCPDAWLINFTNPSGMVTEAVIKHFGWKKCIGLCNVPTIAMMAEPKLLGKDISQLNYRYAGINHFHWHKVFDENGNDMTPILIDHINEKGGGTPANIYQAEFPLELLHSMNMVPCGYHRYYYMKQAMLEHAIEEFNEGGTRAEQMKQVEHELFEIYKNAELHEKPEQLGKRGGAYYSDAACECIRAIYANKKIHMVVSTQNNGAISCLDDDSIVEVSSIISATGAQPMAFGKLPSAEKGWLQMMKAMEECTIEAALTGDYGKALEAFVLNPLVENNENTTKVLDELLVAHAKYLPQFKEKIEELKAKGVHSTDPVVMDLMEHGH